MLCFHPVNSWCLVTKSPWVLFAALPEHRDKSNSRTYVHCKLLLVDSDLGLVFDPL